MRVEIKIIIDSSIKHDFKLHSLFFKSNVVYTSSCGKMASTVFDLKMRESQTRHLTHLETLTHQESTLYKATRRLKEPRYRHKNGCIISCYKILVMTRVEHRKNKGILE